MDLYRLTVDYLLTFHYFDSWHEMKTILRRAVSTRPRDWQRPIVAFQAVRGSLEKAIAASTVLDCAQISFIADEAAYWRLVQNKNAPFYECALHLGYFWRKLESKASARPGGNDLKPWAHRPLLRLWLQLGRVWSDDS